MNSKSILYSIFTILLSIFVFFTPFTALGSSYIDTDISYRKLHSIAMSYYGSDLSNYPALISAAVDATHVVLIYYDNYPEHAVYDGYDSTAWNAYSSKSGTLTGFTANRIELTFDASNVYKQPSIFYGSGHYLVQDYLYKFNDANFSLYDTNDIKFYSADRDIEVIEPNYNYEYLSNLTDINSNILALRSNIDTYLSSINSSLTQLVSNTQGLQVFFSSLDESLASIYDKVSNISTYVNSIRTTLTAFRNVTENQLDNILAYLEAIYTVFALDSDHDDQFGSVAEMLSMNGWMMQVLNALLSLPDVFHDMLFDLYHEIDNEVNPLSEDNEDSYNAAITNFMDNTFIGSVKKVVDDGTSFFGNLDTTQEHCITMSTFDVTFCGIYLPSYQIKLDLSWYERIRPVAHNIVRAFIYIWWIYKFMLVRIYELLNGVGASAVEVASNYMPDVPTSTEHVTFDDNGIVTSHSTRTRNKDGSTVTQFHKV